jgi:phage gp36-like protein
MAYIGVADLIERYGADYVTASCDRDQNGDPDTSALERALDEASARIDARLEVRYTVPVSPVPAVLASLCGDIAIYLASTDPLALTDDKRRRYEDAMKELVAIASGAAGLGVVEVVPAAPSLRFSSPCRIFTRSTLRYF